MILIITVWLSLWFASGVGTLPLAVPIQVGGETAVTHTVQPGETLLEIAVRYNVAVVVLVETNRIADPNLIFAGQTLIIPAAETAVSANAPHLHIVQPGQTMSGIAVYYGVSLAALTAINAIPHPDYIQAGQRLIIPPAAGATAAAAKRIVVDLSAQRAFAYAGEVLANSFVVSTGRAGQETAVGAYHIQNKLPTAYASTWGLQMPYWLGIYWAGPLQNGFHALPILADGSQLWRGYLGTPISYGCIVLSPEDAQWLYNWAEVGTAVIVQP